MLFSSPVFLFIFLPVTLALNLLLERLRLRRCSNILLLLASLLFYAWGEPYFVVIMALSAMFNYGAAFLVTEGRRGAKLCAVLCVVVNIGLLFVFKYLSFFVQTLGFAGLRLPDPQLRLPIGISFYTFQALSYVLDVRAGRVKPERNPLNLMLYITFFPQLIAGPIVQYKDIALMLRERGVTSDGLASGIRRFIAGLSKKLLIANTAALLADAVFGMDASALGAPAAWLGAVAYAVQIYFDFSGYSDMALGLGRMFGFEFRENFNYPYAADSVQGFWRRWHISLSTWFRDYLYIPLGGNRRGALRTDLNRLCVFLLTGLWHGANWTFVIWGLFHGALLMLEQHGLVKPRGLAGRAYTLLCVAASFVMFRADTVGQGFLMLRAMFAGFAQGAAGLAALSPLLNPVALGTLLLAAVLSQDALSYARRVLPERLRNGLSYALSLPLMALCMLNLSSAAYNPFIYFRF